MVVYININSKTPLISKLKIFKVKPFNSNIKDASSL